MTRVKVIYDRDKCIGAVTCANLNPELWKMNRTDAKADLLGSKEEKGKFVLETEMSMYLQMAAEQCPVGVIEIYDAKTKKRLF
jgi:ferredoxin